MKGISDSPMGMDYQFRRGEVVVLLYKAYIKGESL